MSVMKTLIVAVIITLRCDIVLASTDLWPSGRYSLPKPKSGCPRFWKEGWLRQDIEDDEINESKLSSSFHMDATLDDDFIQRRFCTKVTDTSDVKERSQSWPKGFYCIYRKSYSCPHGMVGGSIYWDDEDSSNGNLKYGYLPDSDDSTTLGSTRLYYCCQREGKWHKFIELPTEKPFYLLPYGSRNCQRVMWAVSSLEYIIYDTENRDNADKFDGHHVFTDKVKSLPKIFYCYYEGCQYMLPNEHGWFASANFFNSSYPDFQYCSWSIKVNVSERISLKFHTLDIPNCKENYLDIYDGGIIANTSNRLNGSTLPARFCGENATAGTILTSKTNKLYIVLKSGNNSAMNVKHLTKDVGFYAEYEIFQPETTSVTSPTTTPTEVLTNITMSSFDSGNVDVQNGNNENSAIYFIIVLSILAILILFAVVAGILCWRRHRKKNDAAQAEQKQNRPPERSMSDTPVVSPSTSDHIDPSITANPIYESVYDNYFTESMEMHKATDKALYELENEAFEGNPIYGLNDVDSSTYTKPISEKRAMETL